jgi:hypothetical protein
VRFKTPTLLKAAAMTLLSTTALLPALAQSAYETTAVTPNQLPAGNAAFTATVTVYSPSGSPPPNFCVYSGYGSTAPITPTSVIALGNANFSAVIAVPASITQQIPASAYASGSPAFFSIPVYVPAVNATTCTAYPYSTGASNIILNFPTINGLSLSSIPDQNPNLSARIPSNLNLSGTFFVPNAGGSSSTVTYTGGSTTDSSVATVFVKSTELRSNLPTNIPAGSGTLNVTECNQSAGNSYCSSPEGVSLYALGTNAGTLSATPNPPSAGQATSFTADFGPPTPVASYGAPGGLVTFSEGNTTLGTAPLVLDTTAQLAQIQVDRNNTATFNSTATALIPFIADFNNDGVPDTMYLDPAASTFHILLGVSPYAYDQPIVPANNSCSSIPAAAVGDFNNDGVADISYLCQVGNTTQAFIMLGLGDGSTFSTPVSIASGTASKIAGGDFNHDGNLDLVLLTTGNSGTQVSFTVYVGDGTGNFTAQDTSGPFGAVPSQAAGTPNQFLGADINGDGATDLVLLASAGSSGPGVYVFQNVKDGNSHYGSFASPLQPINGNYSQVLVTPLNTPAASPAQCTDSCTLPSLIAVSSTSLVTALNTSTGSTVSFSDTLEGTTIAASSVAAGDFNGDGFIDVAIVGQTGIEVLTGDAGGFSASTYTFLTDTSAPTNGLLIGAQDENGDGFADLFVLNQQPNECGASPCPISYTELTYFTAGTSSATFADQSGFAPGAHTITATTPGTYTIAGGTASTSFTVAASYVTPSVTLTATPATGTAYGTAAMLTATVNGTLTEVRKRAVSPNYGGGGTAPPTGSVTFFDGMTQLGSAMVSGSSLIVTATYNAGLLAAGTHSLSAQYSGDTNYNPATGTLTYVVGQATPSITWVPNPASIVYGTPLGSGQLDATASVPGTFAYTPASGALLNAGTQTLSAVFTPTDTTDYKSVNATAMITVTSATPTITWVPNPSTIVYGTALGSGQLDATSTVPGTFAYTPAAGAVPSAGQQTLSAVFTPSNTTNYQPTTLMRTITVTQATPVLSWTPPAAIISGTPLSGTQLDATAAGVTAATLPGSFTYTPAAGTVLSSGSHQLSALFTPTDAVDYTTASISVPINVISFALASVTPNTASLGDPDKPVVLTGTGFLPNSSVLVNGNPVATTYVSATSLQATIPASNFLLVQTLEIAVSDTAAAAISNALPISVTAPPVSVQISGPSTTQVGLEPQIFFTLEKPYPVAITGSFTLSFAPANGSPDDPMIRFASPGTNTTDPSGRTFGFTIPANSTAAPTVLLQSGSTAGVITINLTLFAGGANITPSTVQPLVITEPDQVPGATSVSLSAQGKTLTVVVRGYSNTREISQVNFHFDAAPGASIATKDLQLDDTALFSQYYASAISAQYGSTFTYTQTFNLDEDATVVGAVQVTLTNSVGVSALGSSE